jgi:hypothetical protein
MSSQAPATSLSALQGIQHQDIDGHPWQRNTTRHIHRYGPHNSHADGSHLR